MYTQCYKVYHIQYVRLPGNYHALYDETTESAEGPKRKGLIFQVVGTIREGMMHGHRLEPVCCEGDAAFSPDFYECVGKVAKNDLVRIQGIVEKVEAPPKQFAGVKRPNPQKSLKHCQTWTVEAIQALRDAGVLKAEEN
jgi:hypothetical protein